MIKNNIFFWETIMLSEAMLKNGPQELFVWTSGFHKPLFAHTHFYVFVDEY